MATDCRAPSVLSARDFTLRSERVAGMTTDRAKATSFDRKTGSGKLGRLFFKKVVERCALSSGSVLLFSVFLDLFIPSIRTAFGTATLGAT